MQNFSSKSENKRASELSNWSKIITNLSISLANKLIILLLVFSKDPFGKQISSSRQKSTFEFSIGQKYLSEVMNLAN